MTGVVGGGKGGDQINCHPHPEKSSLKKSSFIRVKEKTNLPTYTNIKLYSYIL